MVGCRIKDSRFLHRPTLILGNGYCKLAAPILEIIRQIVGNGDVTVVIIDIGDSDESFMALTAH